MSEYDVAIVGAGPAGSAAAAVLARRGRRALLIEKDRFPRPKVCGEFLSGGAAGSLASLGVLEKVASEAERIENGRLHLSGGRMVAFRLPAPAFGISRFRLDDLLARRAEELGAETRFGVRVLAVEGSLGSGFRLRLSSGARDDEVSARSVVGAWGRWDALDRALGRSFLGRRPGYFGWSRDYEGDTGRLAGQVRLYAYRGGYCGLSRVERGTVNLAGIVSRRARRTLAAGWESVVAHARAACPDLDRSLSGLSEGPIGFLGTGPVFFTAKPAIERGVLMAGDAAGVIDPFSGQGQAAALASGMLAADTLERGFAGEIPIHSVAPAYAAAWKRLFARRFAWSAVLRRLVLNPFLAALAAPVAGEGVVRFALERLSLTSPERPQA